MFQPIFLTSILITVNLIIASLITASLVTVARASEAGQEKTITITASRRAAELSETSSSIDLVSDRELNLIAHVHINQALARIPGTWISRGNGQEHLTAIRSPVLTGAGACGAFFMAEDNISLRAPGFCNVNQLFDANTEQASRIEVVRGPGSVLHGSNAVHGTINIISPDLFDTPLDYLGLETGPYDYFRGRFSFSHQQQQHAFGIYGNLTNDGGFQSDSGFDQQKLNLLHQYQSGDFTAKSMLSAANINQETAGFIRGKDAFKDDLLRRTNPNPEAFRNSTSWRAYSQLNWILSGQSQLTVTPYARYTDMEFIQHFVPWKPIENNNHYSLGVKSSYSFKEDNFNWHVGVDWEFTQGELNETQLTDFSPNIPQGVHYDYEVNSFNISPFVDFSWALGTNLVINAGTRYDRIRYDYENRLSDGSACSPEITNCRFIRPGDQTRNFSHWSPRLSLVYLLNQQATLYTELTQGFRAPQTTELFRLQAGQQSADLETERLSSIQTGLRGQLNQLSYDLAVYAMEKRNFIFQDTERQNVSNGETSHRGIELSLAYPFNDNWQFSLAASHARHQYENNILISRSNIKDNEIDTAPKQMANARLSLSASADTLLELELLHLGDYFLDPANTATYSGHTLVHLRGQVKLGTQTELSFRLVNLTDRDYAERADFAFGNYRYFVGQPRTLFLGFNYKLD